MKPRSGTRPGGLWESVDDCETFVHRETGMPSSRDGGFHAGGINVHPRVAGLWFAGTEANGPYRSRDNGVTWESVRNSIGSNNERHGICIAYDLKDDATLYYGSDMGIFKSTNHGESWAAINHGWDAGVDQEATAELIKQFMKKAGDNANPQLKASYERVLLGEPLPGGWMKGWTFDLRMAATDPQILFAAAQRRLIRTSNGGENWSECPTVAHPRSVAIHPKDPQIVVASGTWQVWLSRDGGDSWTDVTRDLGDPPASDPQAVPHTQCLEFDPAGESRIRHQCDGCRGRERGYDARAGRIAPHLPRTAVAADRVKLQGKDGVHFSDEHATILGNTLTAALAKQLKPSAGALR